MKHLKWVTKTKVLIQGATKTLRVLLLKVPVRLSEKPLGSERIQTKVKALFLFGCMGILGSMFVIRVYATQNYSEPDKPRFVGSYAREDSSREATTASQDTGEISVISYNIRYALNMEEAIAELVELEAQQGADIILLQEMDELGVAQVAQALALNYVYYPAGVEPLYRHNFGNAILSPWPINDTQKLFLPHKSFATGLGRVATKATVTVQGGDVLVYSIHAETMMTPCPALGRISLRRFWRMWSLMRPM